MVWDKVDLSGIIIHEWVLTHGIYFILRFSPQNPAPSAAARPPRGRPVRPNTRIWLRAHISSTTIKRITYVSINYGAETDTIVCARSFRWSQITLIRPKKKVVVLPSPVPVMKNPRTTFLFFFFTIIFGVLVLMFSYFVRKIDQYSNFKSTYHINVWSIVSYMMNIDSWIWRFECTKLPASTSSLFSTEKAKIHCCDLISSSNCGILRTILINVCHMFSIIVNVLCMPYGNVFKKTNKQNKTNKQTHQPTDSPDFSFGPGRVTQFLALIQNYKHVLFIILTFLLFLCIIEV